MLLENFYTYSLSENIEGQIKAQIEINPAHKVFEGHFPGHPIVPGVCQILIVKEILSGVLESKLQLASSKSIKFLSMMEPKEGQKIDVQISYKKEDNQLKVNAEINTETQRFLKLRGLYNEK